MSVTKAQKDREILEFYSLWGLGMSTEIKLILGDTSILIKLKQAASIQSMSQENVETKGKHFQAKH